MGEPKLRKYTAKEYLEILEASPIKLEFIDSQIYTKDGKPYLGNDALNMAGASINHNQISSNLVFQLKNKLKGTNCKTFASDAKLYCATKNSYFFPDLMVICNNITFAKDDVNAITNPTIVVEILSDSTESVDRGTKFHHYRQLNSLQEYVLVNQNEARIEIFVKKEDKDIMVVKCFEGIDSICTLESINYNIPLNDIYEGIKLS